MWDLFAKTVSTLLGKTNVCQSAAKNEACLCVCVCKANWHATPPFYRQATTLCEHACVSISGGSGE